jgi:cell division protein FtsW (lipid II flippase)
MFFTRPIMIFLLICLGLLVTLGPLLASSPFSFLMPSRGGAHSVINFVVIDFQPMEFFKIAVILHVSLLYSKTAHKLDKRSIWESFILPGIGLVLILLEPDLGGTIIVFSTIAIMFFLKGDFKGREVLYSVFSLVGIALFAIIALLFDLIHAYQIERITSWITPFNDPDNGGVTGSGYMNSIQKAAMFATESDTIFSVILEEWGFFGLVFTTSILFAIGCVCVYIGWKSKKRYRQIFCYAFSSLILIQSFVNMGGVTGVIPFTGVTLPFISNGINSFFSLSLGLFLVCVMGRNDELKNLEIKEM